MGYSLVANRGNFGGCAAPGVRAARWPSLARRGRSSMSTREALSSTDRTAPLEREITLPFLAGILDALPNPVFVKDERHRWVLLNERFCRLLGRERNELIGHSDYEFFPRAEADEFWRK